MKCGYTTADIQIPDGLEPIRRRPRMYLGGTGAPNLHFLLFELVDSSLASIGLGLGTSVRLTLRADGSAEIEDNGTPPVDVGNRFSMMHAGHGEILVPGTRPTWAYVIANALAEEFMVRVRTPGSVYQHIFRRGTTHAAAQFGGPLDDRGFTVRFRPDPAIFKAARFNSDTIRARLRQCAFLHSGVRITFSDETNGTQNEFECADGASEYVTWLNADRTPLHSEPIVTRGETNGIQYAVGLQWCVEDGEVIVSAANNWITSDGGTHVSGFRDGYSRAFRELVREQVPKWSEPQSEDLHRGLTAVILVRLLEPWFESQFRSRLTNLGVEGAVRSALHRSLREHFAGHSDLAKQIVRAAYASRKRK